MGRYSHRHRNTDTGHSAAQVALHTDTQADRHAYRLRCTQILIQADTHVGRHTYTQIYAQILTQAHRYLHRHTDTRR